MDKTPHPPNMIKEINSVTDAKELMARMINLLQSGELDQTKAKTIAYMLQVYISINKEVDLHNRIDKLEKELNI